MEVPEVVWKVIDPKEEGMCGPLYINGYVGRWRIFSIHSSVMRDEKDILCCDLPGIREEPYSPDTEEHLKEKAKNLFARWYALLHEGSK